MHFSLSRKNGFTKNKFPFYHTKYDLRGDENPIFAQFIICTFLKASAWIVERSYEKPILVMITRVP